MSSSKLGSPEERDTFQGPQGDKLQQQRVLALIEDGKANGRLILGGSEANVNGKVNVLSTPGHVLLMRHRELMSSRTSLKM